MDRGWLERCQVFTEVRDEHKPVAGNTDLSDKDRIALSRPKSDKVAPENLASTQEVSQVRTDERPVNVVPSSGATHEEMKPDHITDNQDDNDQSRPSSETRKPRLQKAQDSKEPDYEQNAVKRKGRKRLRETEEETGQTESVQKRRRTKKEHTVVEKPVKKGRKKKGGAEEEESAPETKASQKPKMPQENLLGEVDEEDVIAASSRKCNPIKSR